MSRIEITDATGVTQLAGEATYPDGFTEVETPDAAGESEPITIKTGDSTTDNSGAILIETGEALNSGAVAGDITIRAGDGDTSGGVAIESGNGGQVRVGSGDTGFVEIADSPADVSICTGGGDLHLADATASVGFYGHAVTPLQTGVAVSAAGIHAALVNLGLITA